VFFVFPDTIIVKYALLAYESKSYRKNDIRKVMEAEMFKLTRMWANAQPDGRPAEHRWRPLFNAAKFG